MTTVTKRCTGHCHCHALPDGIMAPPCCDDCAFGDVSVVEAASIVAGASDTPSAAELMRRHAQALLRYASTDKGRPGYCARCGLGNNNGGVPTEGDSAEVHICPPALVEKALRDALRVANDVLVRVGTRPDAAVAVVEVAAVRDGILKLLTDMEAPPRCPKCKGPTFSGAAAKNDGRLLFVCADPGCGGAVWVLPAV